MDKWIPVEEELPNREDLFLVTLKYYDEHSAVAILMYDPGFRTWSDMLEDEDYSGMVTAWQEMPKPYVYKEE